MTFEEFFAKKKIDLEQLEKAEPALFIEFKSHFSLMGEKSFDHTKKFWFNKLRRLYHLETSSKALTQVETKIASQAVSLSSPTIEQQVPAENPDTKPAQAPKFKPRNVPQKTAEEKDPAETEQTATPKPAGFKPRSIQAKQNEQATDANSTGSRPGNLDQSDSPVANKAAEMQEPAKPAFKFKPRNIPPKPVEPAEGTSSNTEEEKTTPETSEVKASLSDEVSKSDNAAKPAYQPRFKMKNFPQTKADVQGATENDSKAEQVETNSTEPEDAPKPAYKPRFNMKNLPAKPTEQGTSVPKAEEESTPSNTEGMQEASEPPEAGAKAAYKPRFSMKNIPKKTLPQQESTDPEEVGPQPASPAITEPAEPGNIELENLPRESPKPAYKPKFNMRNIKPKNEGEQ